MIAIEGIGPGVRPMHGDRSCLEAVGLEEVLRKAVTRTHAGVEQVDPAFFEALHGSIEHRSSNADASRFVVGEDEPHDTDPSIRHRFQKRFFDGDVDDHQDDVFLEPIIEATSRLIDNLTGRQFHAVDEKRYYSPLDAEIIFIDDLLTPGN